MTHRSCFHIILKVKGKAVPLHAMEALGGRGGIAPTHFDLGIKWGEWSASLRYPLYRRLGGPQSRSGHRG
jgi:hypothetical protein